MKRIEEKIQKLKKIHSGLGKEAKKIWNNIVLEIYDFEIELDDSIKEYE